MTIEVPGRIDTKGQIIKLLDASLLRERLRSLIKYKPDAITISLINSFADPAHEIEAMEVAKEIFPAGRLLIVSNLIDIYLTIEPGEVPISISSEVCS